MQRNYWSDLFIPAPHKVTGEVIYTRTSWRNKSSKTASLLLNRKPESKNLLPAIIEVNVALTAGFAMA